jgi:hypothetical protein
MDSDFELALISASLIVLHNKQIKRQKRRTLWARSWLLRRQKLGLCENLLLELELEDVGGYKNWMRMKKEDFMHILSKVEPKIAKKDTNFRESISANHRLSITLRYLATGKFKPRQRANLVQA